MGTKLNMSSYETYKKETEELKTWLGAAASRCGYGDPKALECAKVPVQRWLKCAAALLTGEGMEVPGHIVELARHLISSRQIFAARFSSIPHRTLQQQRSDEGHRHFISVVQNVLDILSEVRARQKRRTARGAPTFIRSGREPDEYCSRYALLDLEEPTEEPLGSRPKLSLDAHSNSVEEASQSTSMGSQKQCEQEFALFCMLSDLQAAQSYAADTWRQYVEGQLSFATTTAVTNAAFATMRRANEQYLLDYPELDTYEKVLGAHSSSGVMGNCEDTSQRPNLSTTSDMSWHCVEARRLSQEIASRWTAMTDDFYSNIDTNERLHGSVPSSELHHFAAVFLNILPAVYHTVTCSPYFTSTLFWRDEFLAGFATAGDTFTPQTWHVMAMKCYMDIYDIFGDPAPLVRDILDDVIGRAEATLYRRNGMDFWSNEYCFATQAESMSNQLKHDRELLRAITASGSVTSPGATASSKAWLAQTRPVEWIFQILPVSASERIRGLTWGFLHSGAIICNDRKSILSLAYIYKLLRQHSLLSQPWRDMEWLDELHSSSGQAFVIDAATGEDPIAYLRHFALSMGISSLVLPKSRDPEKLYHGKTLRKEPRHITVASPFTRAVMEKISSHQALGTSQQLRFEDVLHLLPPEKKQSGTKSRHGTVFPAPQHSGIHLPERYKNSLIADEPEQNFDYISFQLDCAARMKGIQEWAGNRFTRAKHDDTGQSDTVNTSHVLHDIACYITLDGKTGLCRASCGATPIVMRLLEMAIRMQGGKYMKEAFERSSGFIPVERRPRLCPFGRMEAADSERSFLPEYEWAHGEVAGGQRSAP